MHNKVVIQHRMQKEYRKHIHCSIQMLAKINFHVSITGDIFTHQRDSFCHTDANDTMNFCDNYLNLKAFSLCNSLQTPSSGSQ